MVLAQMEFANAIKDLKESHAQIMNVLTIAQETEFAFQANVFVLKDF